MSSPGQLICAGLLITGMLLSYAAGEVASVRGDPNKPVTRQDIQNYFMLKERQHFEAVETMKKFQRYEQKYEMLLLIFGKIFNAMEASKATIENSEYILGGDLPTGTVLESILHTLDNCAFFSKLILKLPAMSDRILKKNNQWSHLYKWCLTFSISANLVDDTSLKMLNLAAQQLNVVPKDEDFVNPYSKKSSKNKNKDSSTAGSAKKKTTLPKRQKGPRMSKVEL